jgi:hypothetical protein
MRKYAVWIEIGEGESMYATMDNPFTYDIEPVWSLMIWARAEPDYAKLWKRLVYMGRSNTFQQHQNLKL